MSGSIYLLDGDGGLVPMGETEYDSEDLLQGLLAKHADLLAGDQIDPDRPRRWLLGRSTICSWIRMESRPSWR
jgi:hypothetical protein